MLPFCAVVDWGTSRFRMWIVDAQGDVLAERRSDQGISRCRTGEFGSILEQHLEALGAPQTLPVMICGMAGSRQGWVEAPYETVPTALPRIAERAVRVDEARRHVRIIPGIALRDSEVADVMRGEETLLLGAFGSREGVLTACVPGTHSKWVSIRDATVERFTTFMTGDLYSAIREHTILAHSASGDDSGHDEAAFRAAVLQATETPANLTGLLFNVRGRELLGYGKAGASASALSGLLIGTEIAAAMATDYRTDRVHLVASGTLRARYEAALHIAGIAIDATDSDAAVIAGLHDAATRWLVPDRMSASG